jgi:hypothetical protein
MLVFMDLASGYLLMEEVAVDRSYLNVAPTEPWSPWKPHKVTLPGYQASARAWRSASL